jgi:putative ABC transport system permease protein
VSGVNLSGIVYIYRARLEARTVLVQEVFAILGIAVGVALLFASQVASTSLDQSTSQLNAQFVGSAQVQLDARGPEGVSERILPQIRRLPGVEVAMPVFTEQINVVGRRGERSVDLIGVDPRSVRASGPLLRRFSAKQLAAQHTIALPAPLAKSIGVGPLETVKLQIGARFVEVLVGATLSEGDVEGLVNSPIVVAPLRFTQQLAHSSGRISRVFVRYNPHDAQEVRTNLKQVAAQWNLSMVPGHFDNHLFAVAVAPESNSEALFSGISALVGFMFALNAMLITVPSRRALIEDLRLHGASRWDTVKILLFDAALIGAIACFAGLALGDALSAAVFHSAPAYLGVAFPVGSGRVVTWQSVALAVAAGLSAAVAGVFWPLRAILSHPLPPDASADRHSTRTKLRLLLGIPCLALSGVTLLADTQAAIVGNVALVLSLVSLLPLMFDSMVHLFDRLSRVLDGVAVALAATELQTPQTRIRSLAIAATAGVAVFGVVEFQGTQANLEKGIAAASQGTDSTAPLWVMPRGKTSIQPTMPFRPINTATLSHVPGVMHVAEFHGSFLNWGDRRLWVLGPPNDAAGVVPASQILGGNARLASQRVRAGGWAALSDALAAEHHLHVGQAFTLPSPHPLRLRVAALITNLGWPPGALIINSHTYTEAWPDAEPTAYTIHTAHGASPTALQSRLRRALASTPGLAVETAAERNRRHNAIAAEGLSRLTQIRLLVLIAATLAVIGATGAMLWQRRELIAFIKCQGYREALLWRWLLCETLVLLTAGCLVGAAFGLYGQLLLSHVLIAITGFPMVIGVEGASALTSFAMVNAFALMVVALPGYLVVRVPPNTASPAY